MTPHALALKTNERGIALGTGTELPSWALKELERKGVHVKYIHNDRPAPVQLSGTYVYHEPEWTTVDCGFAAGLGKVSRGEFAAFMLRHAGRSGLLLPQVASERGWSAETFLEHTCRKAGLPQGTWRDPEAELFWFTGECYEEPESAAG